MVQYITAVKKHVLWMVNASPLHRGIPGKLASKIWLWRSQEMPPFRTLYLAGIYNLKVRLLSAEGVEGPLISHCLPRRLLCCAIFIFIFYTPSTGRGEMHHPLYTSSTQANLSPAPLFVCIPAVPIAPSHLSMVPTHQETCLLADREGVYKSTLTCCI